MEKCKIMLISKVGLTYKIKTLPTVFSRNKNINHGLNYSFLRAILKNNTIAAINTVWLFCSKIY